MKINCLVLYSNNVLQGEKDDKIIAVCVDDPEYRHYTDIQQLPPHRLAEIKRFFEDCILLTDSLLTICS
jgi:inorganic pyrophosphatase